MNKGNPTGYTAVPSTACPPTVDTEDYQPAAPSYPQFPSEQPPPAYYDDPAKAAAHQQQQTNTVVVSAAQPASTIIHAAVRPPNYLGLSLLNLLCCCFPLGIVGLVYSLRVDSEFAAGRYQEARIASQSAKNINIVGIVIGLSLFFIGVLIVIIDVAAAAAAA